MKFKIDENLPREIADTLGSADHDALTISDQGMKGRDDRSVIKACRREARALVTLDQGFADIRAYIPQEYPGILVFRVRRQDKAHLLAVLRRVLPLLEREPVEHRLWVIEETRVRIRGGQ